MLPIEILLWDASDIGDYIKMAPRTVAEKISCKAVEVIQRAESKRG